MFDVSTLHGDFSDVEKTNGVPLMLAPWGVKKIKLDGRIYLYPLSKEESEEYQRRGSPKEELIDFNDINPLAYCVYVNGFCYTRDGCRQCTLTYSGGWNCVCTADLEGNVPT